MKLKETPQQTLLFKQKFLCKIRNVPCLYAPRKVNANWNSWVLHRQLLWRPTEVVLSAESTRESCLLMPSEAALRLITLFGDSYQRGEAALTMVPCDLCMLSIRRSDVHGPNQCSNNPMPGLLTFELC
jgi:hypothetical protein